MNEILINGAWRSLRKEIARQSGKRSMAIAYVTSDTIPLRSDDVLICDASSRAIKSGNTSATVLDTLHRNGVEIYSLKNLHAKVAVCGLLAIIGSANYSESSDSTLHEAVLVTRDGHLRALALGAIGDLQSRSDTVRLTQSSINRLMRIPVDRRLAFSKLMPNRRAQRTRKVNLNAWISHARYVEEDRLAMNTREKIEEGRAKWRRTFGKSDEEPQWFTMPPKSGLARNVKKGTVILSVGKSGKRRFVDGFYTVYSVAKAKKRVVITCQEATDHLSIPWGRFAAWANEQKVVLSNRSRALSPDEYEKLRKHPLLA